MNAPDLSLSGEPRFEILTFHRSFHGRTIAGISATGQEKVKQSFAPLLAGFQHLPFNDLRAVEKAITNKTVAILMEPVQGEGGIYPATSEFLLGLRRLCDRHGLLLMLDEIQCGLGRLGNWCGWKEIVKEDFVPDTISWAKGIGGGFPLGATWIRKKPVRSLTGEAVRSLRSAEAGDARNHLRGYAPGLRDIVNGPGND